MRVEEITLRQEIRQMLSEAGINKKSLCEMAKEVINEETEKQVKNAFSQSNMDRIIRSKINDYELIRILKEAVRQEICDTINVSVGIYKKN